MLLDKLKPSVISSRDVCLTYNPFGLSINVRHYHLGFWVEEWGLRVMVVLWHFCWRINWPLISKRGI